MRMRNIAAIVVAAHGIGFTLWFMASWVPSVKVGGGTHWLLSEAVLVTGPVGKAFGLLSLVVMVGFLVAAWGLFEQASWWPALGGITGAVSMAIVIPWWTVVRPFNALGATIVNLLLIIAALSPSWAHRLAGTT